MLYKRTITITRMKDFCTIPEAIEHIKAGKLLIIVDEPTRENQGDLFFPAADVTTNKVNVMLNNCRGLVCVPISKDYARRLELPLMVEPGQNTESYGCNFTLTVDAKDVTDHGISSEDRAKTITLLASPDTKPSDLSRPGHVFPLLAKDGGVLERAGHTEASIEFTELAGRPPAGVICEVLNENGMSGNLAYLQEFAKKHDCLIVAIADLIKYRKKHPLIRKKPSKTVIPVAQASLPTKYGQFEMHVYRSIIDNREHIALVHGKDEASKKPVLTRLHSQCFTGDTLSSERCDCNAQLHQSMSMIQDNRYGLLIYLNQEGRGIGLSNKIKAYALQDQGYDTVEANHMLGLPIDARSYTIAAEILEDLNIHEIDLLTNNPEKENELRRLGVKIHSTIPLETPPNVSNIDYLLTKKRKLGHRLTSI